ncbi:solute carrier family 23 protein [Brevibacterium atlanticum]|nr:bifunctional SulP family inorganic anion transporter/carbonic anhydrase [Brevibacterium atlanticum]
MSPSRPFSSEISPAEADTSPNLFRRLFPHARADFSASIVVFLVAVPLSLGIAVASGAPITAGLIAAAVGAIVAGSLGGSRLQVSGPAAGLTVIVAEMVAQYGWRVTTLITLGAGIIQIIFGLTRLSRFAQAIPPVVVHGMLAGIGLTIALSQLNVMLGGEAETGAVDSVTALPAAIAAISWPAVILGGTVIAVMVLWPRVPAKLRVLPAALVAIIAATLLSIAFADVVRVQLGGSLLGSLSLPELPDSGLWGGVLFGMLTVALIASVESLLSAVAIERMRPGTETNTDRELIGQGTANVVSGFIGGLPITGVIVRSATNVKAGAQTRASGILHGVWILLFSIVLVGVIELIPMAALAGLLIMMGIGLVKIADMRTAYTHGELAVYVVTVICVSVLNLLEGVLCGLLLAAVLLLVRGVRSRTKLATNADGSRRLTIEGALSFLAVPRLSKTLASIPPGCDVTVVLSTDYLDHTAFEHLHAWKSKQEASAAEVTIIESGESNVGAPPGPTYHTWSEWQRTEHSTMPRRTRLLRGVAAYHENVREVMRPTMSSLAGRQEPSAMLITCADSRVVPHMITHSGPGDVFTVQNVGNLATDPGASAAIEFATSQLEVPLIAVCGHSGCGAMAGLLSGVPDSSGSLGQWLRTADPALEALRAGHPVAEASLEQGFSEADQLAMVNVALQVARLRARLPETEVLGLFYDIASAQILVLDDDEETFSPTGDYDLASTTSTRT